MRERPVHKRVDAHKRLGLRVAPALACCLSIGTACADESLHGRLELQDGEDFARGDSLAAAVGAREWNDVLGNLRITWEPVWGHWSFAAHYLLSAEEGDTVRIARAESTLLPPPPATWFNLTNTFTDHDGLLGTQGIDRLALGYTTQDFVFRVGRQALTWGSGLVFRPMDLFDPFAPNATDTEYKPGTDMIYSQLLFQDGSDLEIVAVPRPERTGSEPASDASSAALKYSVSIFGHRTTWLLARDRGDWVGAVGVNGPLGGATWNVEIVPTAMEQGPTLVSVLANLSDALTLAARDATVFAEYYRNGFGVGRGISNLASLPSYLTNRLARGQLFEMRHDYLAAGIALEASPLLTVSPTLLADLDDRSSYLLLAVTWSLRDNLNLIAGAQQPFGRSGTEYGGIALAAGSAVTLAPVAQIYLQIRQYF